MLRPRESRELHLISSQITVTPDAILTWSHDVFGNAVTTATFQMTATNLVIGSVAELRLDAVAWPVFDIAFSAMSYPFRYSDDDWIDLGALAAPRLADVVGGLRTGTNVCSRSRTETLSLLKDLSFGVSEAVRYQTREDEVPKRPRNAKSWLGLMPGFRGAVPEAARMLGFGARISRLSLQSEPTECGSSDAGSTHAWAEVFVPGAGWITFDPTNRGVGGFNLIPVAVVRDIRQAMPVSGSFVGGTSAFAEMSVEVLVTS